jgi:hypothetical protein
MPRVPKRSLGIIKVPTESQPMLIKEFMDDLRLLRDTCRKAMNLANRLESAILYRGLSTSGPIVDTNDDIPF